MVRVSRTWGADALSGHPWAERRWTERRRRDTTPHREVPHAHRIRCPHRRCRRRRPGRGLGAPADAAKAHGPMTHGHHADQPYLIDPSGPAADARVPRGHRHRRPLVLRRQHHRRHDLPRRPRRSDGDAVPARRPGRPDHRRRAQGDRRLPLRRGRRPPAGSSSTTSSPASWSAPSRTRRTGDRRRSSTTWRSRRTARSTSPTRSGRCSTGSAPDDYATDGVETLPVFLDFTGTALQYTAGFNVNGIAATPDGRYLVLAQSNTGKLYRVGVCDRRGHARSTSAAPRSAATAWSCAAARCTPSSGRARWATS